MNGNGLNSADNSIHEVWHAGAAKRVISPREPIWLSGYCYRRTPAGQVSQDIHARALALKDETGTISVLLCADILGFDGASVEIITDAATKLYGIRREHLVVNASHSHSVPVTSGMLESFYALDNHNLRVVEEYTHWLRNELIELIGDAINAWQPVELAFGQGLAGFGVNRRRTHEHARNRPGVTDHDVPVLTARTPDGALFATVFGYACHATVSNGETIHGDYPGFAQDELENRFPGATALFITGCGGDINPLPRYRADHPQIYGRLLADAVHDVILSDAMEPVSGPLHALYAEVELPLQPTSYHELKQMVEDKAPFLPNVRPAYAEALATLERGESLRSSCTYAIQTWRFGSSLSCIWLGGEAVVDYSLRFKERYGWENTWVASYCSELLAYIPSERVLAEGGYEGGGANLEYGIASYFASGIEEIITNCVDDLMTTVPADLTLQT